MKILEANVMDNYVLVKVALYDTPTVLLANDAFVFFDLDRLVFVVGHNYSNPSEEWKSTVQRAA
jgi:hypothetical protein